MFLLYVSLYKHIEHYFYFIFLSFERPKNPKQLKCTNSINKDFIGSYLWPGCFWLMQMAVWKSWLTHTLWEGQWSLRHGSLVVSGPEERKRAKFVTFKVQKKRMSTNTQGRKCQHSSAEVDAVKNHAVLLVLQMADSHLLIAEAGKKVIA